MNGAGKTEQTRVKGDSQNAVSPPVISLPKGGGAIRGMGEKFAANPVTGTGSMTVPIATSPGRSGFGPQLSLSYDSGAGNGPYGFGWSLSLPSITRKTDKGLPRYEDAGESDVFILSGAEDLVPVFRTDPTTGGFVKDANGRFVYDELPRDGYLVRRYRPRIEGLFARIERWTNVASGEIHWRSITRDNITSLYGRDNWSRVFDSAELDETNPGDLTKAHPTRIFSWLICETYDDKGNAIVYKYKAENSDGIDLAQAHENNRTLPDRSANRYPIRILYGNRTPNRDLTTWEATDPGQLPDSTWMFEIAFDYDDGHYQEQQPDADERVFAQATIDPPPSLFWSARLDPFSTYRAGFEVRTYRLCHRVLMFHHFHDELGTADYLVRSTEFSYQLSPIASFITEVTQSGYVRRPDGSYLKKSLPPLAFDYSQAIISEEVRDVDPESLQNLPNGADGASYQWLDLDGEGLQSVLAEQEDGWYYKRNVSPLPLNSEAAQLTPTARFDPVAEVATLPSFAQAVAQHHQFLDLAGDGQLDCVVLDPPVAGFFERTSDQDWEAFKPLPSLPNLNWKEPNLRFVDLTGDGHADILITEDDALVWHPALAETGFGDAIRISKPRDEEKGPVVAFADASQSIFLADLSGDSLTDIVRVRNGEICYWPNLGYGRFGPKVTMDNAPWFDSPDQFDEKRLRLADIDGSGTTDIIYLHRQGVNVYRNQCGNAWSGIERLSNFPLVDNVSSVQAVDLLGNGTACLVWMSPLPGDSSRPMRYIDLMGGQKPHLLVKTVNNLGAETVVQYAPSTKFYLQDKLDGKPWITRLPFPVHVVERVETHDLISRNRFVTRYAYHHGYFDGEEREFRGFGMVEQWDTEELGALKAGGTLPEASNLDESSYVPPAYTKTWFHTGAYIEDNQVSRHFEDEYYHEGDESENEPGLTAQQLEAMLLPDTELPTTLKRLDGSSLPWELTAEEIREACRALKGAILRREVYAHDGTDAEDRPYSATEQNYTIEMLQPKGNNKHTVFFTHPRESIDFHYERKLVEVGGKKIADPRVTHAMTLQVDGYGNVLKSVAIGYGRRPGLSPLQDDDRNKQERIHVTCTENEVTKPIDEGHEYRAPLPSETRTYEVLRTTLEATLPGITNLFGFVEILGKVGHASDGNHDLPYEDIHAAGASANHPYRRLIEQVRTIYRSNDLSTALAPGQMESLAIPFESYKLAFTPGLLSEVFQRNGQALLPDPAAVLGGQGPDQGGYVHFDGNGQWWIPSGKVFFHPDADIGNPSLTAPLELAEARAHCFLQRKFADPFNHGAIVDYDTHDLLVIKTEDALENTVESENDYRALQPRLLTDPNGNRNEVAFDALGLVVGTAVMGKASEIQGDLLDASFEPDPTQGQLDALMAGPREPSVNPDESVAAQTVHDLLGKATTRVVYDLNRFQRLGEPPFAATFARETHVSDLQPGLQTKIQISFSYSDGFGREIQKKIQAEPGPVPQRDANGNIIIGPDGQPVMTPNPVSPRWVGSGWTIFNNKGKPVRQYEPFFTDTHQFDFEVKIGVSPVLFYDPVERVVATLHPNHTYEKLIFDPWQQTAYDVNDTVTFDPKTDADIREFVARLQDADYLPTWYEQRLGGLLGEDEQDAADKVAVHANTPSVTHADSLGRTFLTVVHNKFKRNGVLHEEKYPTRVELDIEGKQREVRDAVVQAGDPLGRIVMRYDYDMLGHRIHQTSMEAGERWMLSDVTGKPLYVWDSRDHQFRTVYDPLRRPIASLLRTGAAAEILVGRSVYGETQPNPEANNLRGKVVVLRDQAGIVTSDDYDFKGNLVRTKRQLAQEYKNSLDWSGTVPLEADSYINRSTYDALNRPSTVTTPDSSTYRPTFNEANLLDKVDVNLRGDDSATSFVTNINYNAKGQRELISYGNGASTSYDYDPQTFRLIHLKTTRTSNAAALQDVSYSYDPAGNITHIRDDAQQTTYFKNTQVEPSADYTYDAIYRLIEARGREHLGQVGGAPTSYSYNDAPRVGLLHPGDGKAMGLCLERYVYDAVGNFLSMRHIGSDPTNPGWTRTYAYNQASLLEPAKQSNRLSSTSIGNGTAITEQYSFDAHGNMLQMLQLQLMQWDYRDHLQMTQRQKVSDDDTDGVEHHGERTYYIYDSSGQRVRRVTELGTGQRKEERIYLGGVEAYREIGANALVRETLHIMDNKQRIALVETRTQGNDDSPVQLTRYQLTNHLGSSTLELDDEARIITYEEYTPYGSTSYHAVRSQTEAPKRYRYTAKERDEETGLYYHGARYYACWLGRWISCDPAGLVDGLDLYFYATDNPICLRDPTGTQTKAGDSELHAVPVRRLPQGLEGKVQPGGMFFVDKRGDKPAVSTYKGSDFYEQYRESGGTLYVYQPDLPEPAGEEAPSSQPAGAGTEGTGSGGTKKTILDKATEAAGVANLQTTGKEGVSGGIPGGTGPKENASALGQVGYIAVTALGVIDLARGLWGAGKAAARAVGGAYRTVAGRIAGDRALKEGLKELVKEEAQRAAETGMAASAAQGEKLKSGLAARHVANAERVGTGGEILNDRFKGSGLKSDPTHRAASFLTEEELAKGRVFPITGNDGVRRTLLQVPGNVNGKQGIVEYIIDHDGTIVHQRFIEGGVIGAGPNGGLNTGL